MNVQLQTTFSGNVDDVQMIIPLGDKITEQRFEIEREHIFKRSWMMIGHTDELPLPGSYFVYPMPVLKTSLLVIRGQDGVIRAFHNVCRHRGNVIVRNGEGCRSSFTCGFHGWTWNSDGSLRGITDEGQFQALNLDKSKLGLLPVATDTWNGFIFVNADPEPAETLTEWLGELAEGYDSYFADQERISLRRVEIDCNWNLAINSFVEGYHTRYIHRNTMPDYQGGKTNKERHRPFMQLLKRHTRYSAPANPDHKFSEAEKIAFRHGPRLLPAAVFDNSTLPAAVNPSRAEHWLFDVIQLFPNLVLLIGQNWHTELLFQPVSANKTVLIHRAFTYKAKTLAHRVSREFFRTRAREVLREDLNTLEAQHAALASGVLPEVYLSRQELAVAHHFRVAENMIGGAQ